jgi:soluble P-type ATPase
MLDFTGTLARDGTLLPGVASRLRALSRRLTIVVATADTLGKAITSLDGLPVEIKLVKTGQEKLRLLEDIGPSRVMAIGNGRNDVPMVRRAAIGVAVVGPEGAASDLIGAADIVVHDIRDGLDFLAKPLRLTATLRP